LPVPQNWMLVSVSQVPVVALPHRCVPVLQVHCALAAGPVQVVPVGQGLQELPHVAFAVFDTQAVPHRWVPVAHVWVQAPSVQESDPPPAGGVQAVQPFAVQPEATLLFWTQVVPHKW